MNTLPHTGLEVPDGDDNPHVTSLKELNTRNGVAFTAVVRIGKRRIGTLDNDGNGGGTWFHQDTFADYQTWNRFVTDCRHAGLEVHAEKVADALVEEYDTYWAIKRQVRKGGTLARGVCQSGFALYKADLSSPAATASHDARVVQTLMRTKTEPWDGLVTWQVWDGSAWRTVGTSGTPYPAEA
jgi:hypothetical protein